MKALIPFGGIFANDESSGGLALDWQSQPGTGSTFRMGRSSSYLQDMAGFAAHTMAFYLGLNFQ
jgi:hypothetical protein